MTVLERNIEAAVRSAVDLSWFDGYLRGLLDAEKDPAILQDALRHLYETFRQQDNERLADLMLDGLDILTGWCGPTANEPTAQTG